MAGTRGGGRKNRAKYVRALIEREMRRAREESELEMFNHAARDLTRRDTEERERLVGAFSNRDQ